MKGFLSTLCAITIMASSVYAGGGFDTVTHSMGTEMNNPSFWLRDIRDADSIIMTEEEIGNFNSKNTVKINSIESFSKYMTREEISKYIYPVSDIEKGNYFIDGKRLNKNFFEELKENIAIESLKGENEIKYGIAVNRTDIKMYPIEAVVTDEGGSLFFDEFQASELYYNEPVAVLMESRDKNWLLVAARHYYGWVKSDDIAYYKNKEEYIKAQEYKDFLVVTGDKVMLDINPYSKYTSGMVFDMGTKLQLADKNEYGLCIDNRYVVNNYVLRLPVKNDDGYVRYELALMPVSRDVNKGYLPYTTRNVINQCFKRLGDVYGWGGMYDSLDCSGYVKYVYACFGFEFSRDASAISAMPLDITEVSGMSDRQKEKTIENTRIGTLLYFKGHIFVYLGKVNDKYYAISAVGSIVPENEDELQSPLTVMINSLDAHRANGKSWLNSIEKIIEVKP